MQLLLLLLLLLLLPLLLLQLPPRHPLRSPGTSLL